MASVNHFRALARRPVSLPATLHAEDEAWTAEASVVDLGIGGAGLLVRFELPRDTRLKVELSSPNLWETLSIFATVRWSQGPDERGVHRVGVRFEPSSGREVRALADLVASTAYE